MTTRAGWTWAIEVVREDDAPVGQCVVTPDWEPWREWVRWLAVRAGHVPGTAFTAEGDVTPTWDPGHGEPRLEGVRVRTALAEEGFGLDPFREPARAAIATMVRDGRLGQDDLVRWRALAFAREAPEPEPPAPLGRPAVPRIRVLAGRLAATPAAGDGADTPVLVPGAVLDEVATLTLEATGRETGGILIGHLRRDNAAGTVYAEVTAQVPARHTEASATKLTFTPDTWTEVRSAIDLRRREEIMLGWWHSHPVRRWCQDCPEARRPGCALARGFLSEDDRLLHRTVFPRAYSLALVASDVGDGGPTFALFGWRRGLIETRTFTTMGAAS